MKQNKILYFAFSILFINSAYTTQTKPVILENRMLQIADQAGLFNDALPDINLVGKDLIDFLKGNSTWNGMLLTLTITTDSKTNDLVLCFRQPALIYGATYVVLSHSHPNLKKYITKKQMPFYIDALKNNNLDDIFTGSYAAHPLTNEPLPVYISNYNAHTYEVRTNHAHLAIPAHAYNDFYFAKKYNLPMPLVLQPTEDQLDRNFKRANVSYKGILNSPYIVHHDECYILKNPVTSEKFLKGKEVASIVTELLIKNGKAQKYSAKIRYSYNNKLESLPNILKIETLLNKQGQSFSPTLYKEKHAELNRILLFAHADFLDLVELFLVNIQSTKQLMIPLIEESCKKRNKTNCYLLKWTNMQNNESERVRFKKDIVSFLDLASFCSDLIHFLSDLANSCPYAQAYLKSLQK